MRYKNLNNNNQLVFVFYFTSKAFYLIGLLLIQTYPYSWWLPGDGVQRGTVLFSMKGNGDPLTPFYPSTRWCFTVNDPCDVFVLKHIKFNIKYICVNINKQVIKLNMSQLNKRIKFETYGSFISKMSHFI